MITYRKAITTDIPAIQKLISVYSADGIMLHRSLLALYENMRDFAVALVNDEIVGVGALHIMWHDLAEIRSLAVNPQYRGQGIGQGIVELLLQEAGSIGLNRVFALTYQQDFFAKLNFNIIKKETLPQKVWSECVNCHKFNSCDEIAMIRYLNLPNQPSYEFNENLPQFERPNWVRE